MEFGKKNLQIFFLSYCNWVRRSQKDPHNKQSTRCRGCGITAYSLLELCVHQNWCFSAAGRCKTWFYLFLPVDRRVSDVVIHELPPLHHHERVSDMGSRNVVVNVDRNQTGAWKRGPCDRPTPGAHQTIVISRSQEPGEGPRQVTNSILFCWLFKIKDRGK